MGLVQNNQTAKIVINATNRIIELDCVIEKVEADRLRLNLSNSFMRYINYLEPENEVKIRVFTTAGVVEFCSIIINSPLEPHFEVEYDEDTIQLELKYAEKLSATYNLVIKRALLGDIATRVTKMEREQINFYTNTPLQVNSLLEYELQAGEHIINFMGRESPFTPK